MLFKTCDRLEEGSKAEAEARAQRKEGACSSSGSVGMLPQRCRSDVAAVAADSFRPAVCAATANGAVPYLLPCASR